MVCNVQVKTTHYDNYHDNVITYQHKSVNDKNEKILSKQSNDSFKIGVSLTVLIRIFRASGSLARQHFYIKLKCLRSVSGTCLS